MKTYSEIQPSYMLNDLHHSSCATDMSVILKRKKIKFFRTNFFVVHYNSQKGTNLLFSEQLKQTDKSKSQKYYYNKCKYPNGKL